MNQEFHVWKRKLKSKRPGMFAAVRRNYIRISADAYEVIGSPAYVKLLHNKSGWGVTPCPKEDEDSYLVHPGNYGVDYYIRSLAFMHALGLEVGFYKGVIGDGAIFFGMKPE